MQVRRPGVTRLPLPLSLQIDHFTLHGVQNPRPFPHHLAVFDLETSKLLRNKGSMMKPSSPVCPLVERKEGVLPFRNEIQHLIFVPSVLMHHV